MQLLTKAYAQNRPPPLKLNRKRAVQSIFTEGRAKGNWSKVHLNYKQ